MDEFTQFSGEEFSEVDIAVPEILIGGLLGVSGEGRGEGPGDERQVSTVGNVRLSMRGCRCLWCISTVKGVS